MSASESRKDELAARALSRLSDPPLPEGLAARIAARATAMPQIGVVASACPPPAAPAPVEALSRVEPARHSRRRWPLYAAASVAAAALLSMGIFASVGDWHERGPALAEEKAVVPLPHAPQQAPVELVDAPPRASVPAKRPRETAPADSPKMLLPVPVPTAPVELVSEEEPAGTMKPGPDSAQPERLAQTGPQATPQGGSSSIPVYGPPAPSGLGIVGPVGGATSFPGEAESRASRGTPTGPPPSSLPGPSTPRGSGPRR